MVVTKTASRNIAFKAAKMSEAAFGRQTAFVTSEMGEEAFSVVLELFDDVECNADLYVFNHEVVQN